MEIFENLSASSRLEPDELDAYSRAVREVTDSLGPAVISVGTRAGRGGGSGVILGSNDGVATAVTNSHVVRGLRRQRDGGGRLRWTPWCSEMIRRATSRWCASRRRGSQ